MKLHLPNLPKSAIWTVLAVLLLGGGVAAAFWADRNLPYYHFRTVQKGAFYRSSQLSPHDLEKVIDDYRIKTIVNLRDMTAQEKGDWHAKEKEVASRKGVRHIDVGMAGAIPPTPQQVSTLLALWDDPSNQPVLVHCEKGTIRSAAAEGLWRIEYMGESGPQALERVTTWGRDLEKDAPKIADFIRNYVPRRSRAPTPAPAK